MAPPKKIYDQLSLYEISNSFCISVSKMSLADELLADLEDDEVFDDDEQSNLESMEVVPNETNFESTQKQYSSVRSLTKIIGSDELKRIMAEINSRQSNDVKFNKCQIDGPIESHPEYKLVVDANNMAVQIDNDVNICHKFVRDKYSKRFPELESLVPNPMDYLMTVKELANNLEKVKNNEKLQEFLTQATIMVVSVTASTTQGSMLLEEELSYIIDACDVAIELNECKMLIYEFVESRMTFIAPNLTVIIGASIAAKLIGLAGGLTSLSKIPSCNLKSLGSTRKTLSGFSTTVIMPHSGLVFQSEIVQSSPPDLRKKAATLVANKSTLAARADAVHSYPDGSMGEKFREEVERALDKLQEPPPVKQVKPLPAPIDTPKKKRGGKRVRKLKERLVITDLRKQANRLNFAEIEDDAYQNDLGFTTGQMGKSGSGKIRGPQIDEKTKVRISKTLQKNLQRHQQVFGGTTTVRKQVSGTASTIAFTPKQGLEINNPLAAEKKVNEANAKYFSNSSGFFSVKPKTS
ncbi:pre-mRNA processing factor 31 isoform X2 [Dermatophagoides farinae]|uniref:pre-mRNA processing factor 31 isoform X2 n=1 Tax=Dermatophagoides farinae TaxID=6954 RepID=UPI003F622133